MSFTQSKMAEETSGFTEFYENLKETKCSILYAHITTLRIIWAYNM